MQLVAYGAQDVYLTGNPQITFFKVTYRRHTNFSMESIEQTFNGMCDFGRRVQCTIARNGDLAYRTYFQVTLPEINQGDAGSSKKLFARWLDFPGEHMINMVEVEIGGQRIDRQYGDYMHIWNQLTSTAEQEKWLARQRSSPILQTPTSPMSTRHVHRAPRAIHARRVTPFLKQLYMSRFSSGFAGTQGLHYR